MAPRSPFESNLIEWARAYLPAAVSAIDQLPHDRRWRERCLGSIFRARADADVAWLFETVEGPHGDDAGRLGHVIQRAAGYPVRGTFAEWVENIRLLVGVGTPPGMMEVAVPPEPVPVVVEAAPAKRKDESRLFV